MAESIRPMTHDDVREEAREAAARHIPHHEANWYEPGSELWRVFMLAYRDAAALEAA